MAELNNEHVYKYYRWQAWVATKLYRPFAAELLYQWAEDERSNQSFYPAMVG